MGEEHAYAEGEGSRTLAECRTEHGAYRENDPYGGGFGPDSPVVLERFRVLYTDRGPVRSAVPVGL